VGGKLGMKPISSLTTLLFCKTISSLQLYVFGRKCQEKSPKKQGFFTENQGKRLKNSTGPKITTENAEIAGKIEEIKKKENRFLLP
jgi:hypothetical protein